MAKSVQFCPMCAAPMAVKLSGVDAHPREVCSVCGFVHYVNPLPVVGTVPVWGDKVLLCRRAIEPRKGFWTLPAGFMETNETLKDGAARETWEESGAHIEVKELLTLIDVPLANPSQVHFYFVAELQDLDWNPGPETLEQRLFSEDEIPWDEISFTTVKTTLEHYFADRRVGRLSLHSYSLSC